MTNRTLHDISEDMLALDAMLAECEGVPDDEAVAQWIDRMLIDNQHDLDGKVDNYAALITEYESRSSARIEEAERLRTKANADANRARWLRDRLKDALIRLRIERLECRRFTVSVQRNGGMQSIEVSGDVPPEFRVIRSEPDKAAIRTALLEGRELSFARLLPRGESLRIR